GKQREHKRLPSVLRPIIVERETPRTRWRRENSFAYPSGQRGGNDMATMIAARLHAYGQPMTLDKIDVPEPRPTDVLIEVKACGVVPNLARVVSNFFGTLTPDNKMMPPLPAIFGLDPAGVVAKVGSQVFHVSPGERVYVNPGRSCGSCKMCRSG